MSKKHVDKYFNDISNQYFELLDTLHEMEELYSNNLINPDTLEQLKIMIEPLKQNYMRISYIMFLLNTPNKKKKIKRYEEQNKKLLNKIPKEDTLEGIKEENNNTINNLHL